jgi:tetratricopeptide (TPR) repeat protein
LEQSSQQSAALQYSTDAPMLTPVNSGSEASGTFSSPETKKKSLLGQAIDRYRSMNTKQQIIWGFFVLAALWFLLEEDPASQQPARLNTGVQKKAAPIKGDPTADSRTFESLTEQQQRYVETQYQLAFDLYKNREYDKALLEVGRIFTLLQNYKNAREIEAFAREGKRKLEAQEEERKRKEIERQNQLKLQSLLDQARMLMDKRRFSEAEALFPEIELLQPENAAVNEWRKQIIAEAERLELERQEQARIAELTRQAWKKFQFMTEFKNDHQYQLALDALAEIRDMSIPDRKLSQAVRDEERDIRTRIAQERDPLLAQGRELEQSGQLAGAFKAYEKASELDPEDTTARKGMDRIRGNLTARAKALYIEGVFAESYNDLDSAERSFKEILDIVPKGDDYYAKAELRMKRITSFRKPASEPQP